MYQYLLGSENNLPTSEHEVSDVDDYQEYIKMTHNRKSATKINIGQRKPEWLKQDAQNRQARQDKTVQHQKTSGNGKLQIS